MSVLTVLPIFLSGNIITYIFLLMLSFAVIFKIFSFGRGTF